LKPPLDAPGPVTRHYVDFEDGQRPTGQFAVSPDGSMWVYQGPGGGGGAQLWLKRRSEHLATPLAGTEGALAPFFSPDGAWVAFVADRRLKKVSVAGGVAADVAGPANDVLASGGDWLDDGTIVFIEPGWALGRVSEAGGPVERIVEAGAFDGMGASVAFAHGLPGGRGVLYNPCSAGCASSAIYVLDLRTGTHRQLIEGGVGPRYLPTGHLLFGTVNGSVNVAPFDLETLELQGPPVVVLDGVTAFSVSRVGDLLYAVDQTGGAGGRLEWIDRDGTVQVVDSSWTGVFREVSLSPSGTRAAVTLLAPGASGDDIWIKELDDGPASRLTFADGANRRATWSADGRTVTFVSDRGENQDLYIKRADGVGAAELLLDTEDQVNGGWWSPSGEWLIYRTGVGADLDIYARRYGADTTTVPLVVSPDFDAYSPSLSRDEKWLAYVSDESGRPEVYVRPFPNVDGGRWQVSARGGTEPLWAHNGRELFYMSNDSLVVVEFESNGTLSALQERRLFSVQL
jgi:serine/threonine-protein kinase